MGYCTLFHTVLLPRYRHCKYWLNLFNIMLQHGLSQVIDSWACMHIPFFCLFEFMNVAKIRVLSIVWKSKYSTFIQLELFRVSLKNVSSVQTWNFEHRDLPLDNCDLDDYFISKKWSVRTVTRRFWRLAGWTRGLVERVTKRGINSETEVTKAFENPCWSNSSTGGKHNESHVQS